MQSQSFESEITHSRDGIRLHPPITPRENDRLLSSHKDPLWIGQELNYIFPREILDNVARGSVNDGLPFDEANYGGPDMFGVEWVYDPAARGSMEKLGPHLLDDISDWRTDLRFPDLSAIDWDAVSAHCAKAVDPNRISATMMYTGFFERLISFVGFEDAAIAMIDPDQEDDVCDLFDRLCEYYDDLMAHLKQYAHIEYIMFHDDWGTQRSTFFSEAACRERILPYMKRVVASAHKYGLFFNHHCCGKVESFVPLMVEAGSDAWDGQPINDLWALYHQYGDRLNINMNIKNLTVDRETAERWADEFLSKLEPGKQMIYRDSCMNDTLREVMYCKSRAYFAARGQQD